MDFFSSNNDKAPFSQVEQPRLPKEELQQQLRRRLRLQGWNKEGKEIIMGGFTKNGSDGICQNTSLDYSSLKSNFWRREQEV